MSTDICETAEQLAAIEGRDIAAVLNPAPITVIGARDEDGRIGFATVLWAMPVSHKPPLVAFALRPQSHTMGIIQKAGTFSLSTFPADAESLRVIEVCGYKSGHHIDKSTEVAHELVPLNDFEADGVIRPLPVPTHAFAWELCEVESIQEAGDHLLVIGRVLRAASRASRDSKNRLRPAETMLCIQHGAYAASGEII